MLEKLKALLLKASKPGIPAPFIMEQPEGRPSFTLFCAYLSYFFMIGSMIALHFNSKLLMASTMSVFVWALAMVFYKIRRLTNAEIDLDDRSIKLSDEHQSGSKKKEKKSDDEPEAKDLTASDPKRKAQPEGTDG